MVALSPLRTAAVRCDARDATSPLTVNRGARGSSRLQFFSFLDEVQERPRGKREQRRGPLVAASEAGLYAVRLASACRVDVDGGASHGSADLPEGERPVDGGVDRELGAAERPVDSDRSGAAQSAGSGASTVASKSSAPMCPVIVPRSKK
jgi:hypothetical protein